VLTVQFVNESNYFCF